MDPTKINNQVKLTEGEKEEALTIAAEVYPDSGLLPLIIKLQAKSDPFKQIMFSEQILSKVSANEWWTSQKDVPDIKNVLSIIKQLICGVASSASVERVFSSFGLVHSKLRNRLGVERASKLVFLFKYYNENKK